MGVGGGGGGGGQRVLVRGVSQHPPATYYTPINMHVDCCPFGRPFILHSPITSCGEVTSSVCGGREFPTPTNLQACNSTLGR